MEKKAKNTYAIGPWMQKRSAMKEFIQVTKTSLPNVVTVGRIFYHFHQIGSDYQFAGTMVMQPHFLKGYWDIPFPPWDRVKGHYEVGFGEDQNFEEVKATNRTILINAVEKGSLYIKQSDPILKFHFK